MTECRYVLQTNVCLSLCVTNEYLYRHIYNVLYVTHVLYALYCKHYLPQCSQTTFIADGQQSSSSLDVSPQGDEYRCFSHEELSDSDSLSDDGNCRGSRGRGIVNPNYPGFQHLAHELHASDEDSEDEDDDDDNNNSVNHLGSAGSKAFYDKPKFNIPADAADAKDLNVVVSSMAALALAGDAYLSGAKEDLLAADSEGEEKFSKEEREKEEVPRKKEKMDINLSVKEEVPGVRRRDAAHREHVLANRRSVPGAARDKKRSSAEILGTCLLTLISFFH